MNRVHSGTDPVVYMEAAVTNAKQGEMVPTFYMTESNLHDAVVQPFLKFYYKQVYDTIDGITQAQ